MLDCDASREPDHSRRNCTKRRRGIGLARQVRRQSHQSTASPDGRGSILDDPPEPRSSHAGWRLRSGLSNGIPAKRFESSVVSGSGPGVVLPLAATAEGLYKALTSRGRAKEDHSAIVTIPEE